MSTRIPPSLAWLINKRARLDGKIQKASKIIERIRELETERTKWQADLAAIDRTLKMHDIQVDTDCIHPIAPRKGRIPLPYGELTRVLLQFLRESDGEPLSTDTLTMMLINHCANLTEDTLDPIALEFTFKRLRSSVHGRLKNLAADKVTIRASRVHGCRTPHWLLSTDVEFHPNLTRGFHRNLTHPVGA